MKLIAFAGRMKSGKDTLATHLQDNSIKFIGKGASHVRIHGFADHIRDFTVQYLGFTYQQAYDEHFKNELTHMNWENMPDYSFLMAKWSSCGETFKTGPMTYREVLQTIGEMMCRIFPDFWVRKFEEFIQRKCFDFWENSSRYDLLVVKDVRKPLEVERIQKMGGKVVYLTRRINDDTHSTETLLDNFPKWKYDLVIDNQNMMLEETLQVFKEEYFRLKLKELFPKAESQEIKSFKGYCGDARVEKWEDTEKSNYDVSSLADEFEKRIGRLEKPC